MEFKHAFFGDRVPVQLMNAFVSGVMSVSSASSARQFWSGLAFFASYACESMRMVRAISARRTARRTAGQCLFPR